MASVVLSRIGKRFGETVAVADVSLEVGEGEFLTLLGPSGCGKSTLLRIIAGLEPQTEGSVAIAGVVADRFRPKQRDVAMVFQSYALYPHMSVRENLALPLRMRRMNRWQRLPAVGRLAPGAGERRREIDANVRQVAEALEIGPLLSRKPRQLSGGQRQRVAVGRAMVRRPKVFLMDEPLSNLDAKLRVHMRAEIGDLHRRLGITFIYVTHDQAEAMTLSDRVAIMMDGEILQIGKPAEIYGDPLDLRVASFVGSPQINRLPGIMRGSEIELSGGTVLRARSSDLPSGSRVTVGLRPEAMVVNPKPGPNAHPDPAMASIIGEVRRLEYLGSDVFVHVDAPGSTEPLIARMAPGDLNGLAPGERARLGFGSSNALLFDEGGRRLRQTAPQPAAKLQSVG